MTGRQAQSGRNVCCPVHDDRSPSLTITDDGARTLLWCHAGCAQDEILGILGLDWQAMFRDPAGQSYESLVSLSASALSDEARRLLRLERARGEGRLTEAELRELDGEEPPEDAWLSAAMPETRVPADDGTDAEPAREQRDIRELLTDRKLRRQIMDQTLKPLFASPVMERMEDGELETIRMLFNQGVAGLLSVSEALDHIRAAVTQEKAVERSTWNEPVEPTQWLIPDWIVAERVAILFGPPEQGKTFLLAQLVRALVCGQSRWLPARGEIRASLDLAPMAPCGVVYASWEDDGREFHRRIRNAEVVVGPSKIPDGRFIHLYMQRAGAVWAPDKGSRHLATLATWTRAWQQVVDAVERTEARVLILDPIAAAFTSDTMSAALVRAFVSALEAWAEERRITVVLVGHPPKADDRRTTMSGSGDWRAAVRSMMLLDPGRLVGKVPHRKSDGTVHMGRSPKEVRAMALVRDKCSYAVRRWVDPVWLERDPTGGFFQGPKPDLEVDDA